MQFCKFEKYNVDEEIYVNPSSIRRIEKGSLAGETTLHFEDGDRITVRGEIEAILLEINTALIEKGK